MERARDLERERDRGEISKRGMSEAAKKGEKDGGTDGQISTRFARCFPRINRLVHVMG